MAKTVCCEICGKEMKGGFFGESFNAYIGGRSETIKLCEECNNKYKLSKEDRKRLDVKVENYQKTHKGKIPAKEAVEILKMYVKERDEYLQKSVLEAPEFFYSGFVYNSTGHFNVREFPIKDDTMSIRDMVKNIDKSQDQESCCFDKNDITRIEYKRDNFLGLMASSWDFTHEYYTYTVRFNSESTLTYKPCITRTAVLGRGFLVFGFKKSAEQELIKQLMTLRNAIGSDLPIVKVKKF